MKHSEPEYIEIPPELEDRLRKFREERKGDDVGNVADYVIYEDDDVRIWEMTLKPGEWSDLHRHEHDYFLLIDSGDLVAGVMPEGSPFGDWFVGKVPGQGNTVRVPKGGMEWAFNVGEKVYHEFLVELKKS